MKPISFSISLLAILAVVGLSSCSGYDLQNVNMEELPVDIIDGGVTNGGTPTPGGDGGSGGGGSGGGGGVTTPGSGEGEVVIVNKGPEKGKPYCRDDDASNGKSKKHKVLVCHVPEGNPSAAHNILISEAGWLNGHKKNHSLDYLGICRKDGKAPQGADEDEDSDGQCYRPCDS